jgi:acyl carrier protein
MEPIVTIAQRVRYVLGEYFERDLSALSDDIHLVNDLEADSLDLIELLMAIEEELEQDIPDEDAENTLTVGEIISYLSQNDAMSDAYAQHGVTVGATITGRVMRISSEYIVSDATLRDIAVEVAPGSEVSLAYRGADLEQHQNQIVSFDVDDAIVSRAFGRDRPLYSATSIRTPKKISVDADYLFRLARDKSVAAREELAEAMSSLFVGNVAFLNDRERSLMLDVLSRFIHDVEMPVRRIVSKQLANLPDTPKDLAILLANDDIEVAYPILVYSKVLQDSDLIEVVRYRALDHQLAVAIRGSVSETVSDALVETGREKVVRTLLENPTAKISKPTMSYLVEQSKRVDSFQEPILHRSDLEPHLAERMFEWVAAALRQYILDTYEIERAAVDDLLEKATMEAIKSLPATQGSLGSSEELATKLAEDDAVTPELLVAVLREGEVSLFVTLFQRFTGIRERLVHRILFEPGGEGLAIACKAVGIGKAFFSEIFALSRKARFGDEKTILREIRHVLTLYDNMTQDAANQVLRLWQRKVGYLSAIRELELSSAGQSEQVPLR